MGRIGWMLAGGLTVVAVQATTAADECRMESFVSGGDCSKGTVEVRLDCLNWQVTQIKRRLDGEVSRIVPLGPPQ